MTNLPAPAGPAALVPYQELERMAVAIAKSGLFGIKTPDQAIALMLVAQSEGLHPAIAARDYDIIQGRPAKKSEAMLRSFLQSGGVVEWHALTDTVADATFAHPAGGKVRISWDMERAKQAGLTGKDMYKKFPRQMLRSRTISEGVRTVCPMATSGMYVPEEVQDFAPERRETKKVEREIEALPAAPAAEVAEEKKDPNAWKEERASKQGFVDSREQTHLVFEATRDVEGFSLVEWAKKELNELERKNLWGLTKEELRLFHEAVRRAGDAGEKFKKTGPEFAEVVDDVPF